MAAPKGPPAWMKWANWVERRLVQITPISGLNTTVDDSPTGKGRAINASPPSGSASSRTDFQLYDASTSSGKAVGIRFGNISPDQVTCNLGSGVHPYPDDFSATSTPPWTATLAVSGTGLVWVEITIEDGDDANAITSISLDNGATLPTATAPDPDDEDEGGTYTSYFPLGTYSVSSDGNSVVIANSQGIGSQMVGFCAGIFLDPI